MISDSPVSPDPRESRPAVRDTQWLPAIDACALRFRDAIERSDVRSRPAALVDFPQHSCAVATLLLGSYLFDSGYGRFEYVVGEYRDEAGWHSHVWLRQGALVVDITADQFPGGAGAVVVSRQSAWHTSLAGVTDGIADFRLYDEHTEAELSATYATLLALISGATGDTRRVSR